MHREAMASPDNPALGQRPDSAETAPDQTPPPHAVSSPPPATPAPSARRRWLLGGVGVLALLLILFEGIPWVRTTLQTVSTDDAYVNGHVTFVAARVAGQVARVLVDDNNRVRKGDLLVQLDKEPYQVQVNIAQAVLDAAQADLVAAQAQTRGVEGEARSLRFNLDHAIEDVNNQVAAPALAGGHPRLLQSRSWRRRRPTTIGTVPLIKSGSRLDARSSITASRGLRCAQAQLEEALQGVYQIRVALGLPAETADRRRPGARCRPIWTRPSPRSGRRRRR